MTPQDRDYVIRTVLGEAANQGPEGQAAVAHVILNRLSTGKWGKTAQDVVLAPNQFEPWAQPQKLLSISPNSAPYQNAAGIVDQVIGGQMPDPTKGATHFLNEQIVRQRRGGSLPNWAQGQGQRIVAHTFYAPEGFAPAAINQAAPMTNQAPQGQPGMSFSDDQLMALIMGQAQPKATQVSVPPMALPAPQAAQAPSSVAGLPQWAIPASMQGQAQSQPGMSDDDLLAMIAGPKAAPVPEKPKPVSSPTGLDLAAIAPAGDTLGAKAGRLGVGAVRGIGDVADTLAQGIGAVGDTGANMLMKAGVIAPETAKGVSDWRSRINADIKQDNESYESALGDSGLATTGRIAGNIAGTALPAAGAANAVGGAFRGGNMLLNAVKAGAQGAAAGTAGTALTSAASDQPLLDQLKTGAGIGAALGVAGPAVSAAGRWAGNAIVGSGIGQETAKLANAAANKFGIPLSAGQLSESPAMHFLDGVLKKLPFSGAGKHTEAQKVAFNRAVAKEFGETADKLTMDVMANARKRIGAEYDAVEKAITLKADPQLQNSLMKIAGDARNVLDDTEWKKFSGVVGNSLKDYAQTGQMSGAQYQAIKNKGSPLTVLAKSSNSDIAHYANQIMGAMKDNMIRSAPQDMAKRYLQADKQYAIMKAVQPLVKKATTGDISPALLMSKSGDSGNLYDLARIGQRFLKEAPSSGTSERHWWQKTLDTIGQGAGLGVGGGAAYYGSQNPDKAALGLGGIALTLAAGRGAGAVMRSDRVVNKMIQSGLRQQAPARAGNALTAFGNLPGAAAIASQRASDRRVPAR